MIWFMSIVVLALVRGILIYINTRKSVDVISYKVGSGLGCGYFIFEMVLALAGLAVLIAVGGWLFG
jgi:hypothetical protein